VQIELKLAKGEFHEHNRICSAFIDPSDPSHRGVINAWRVDTAPGSKLLVSRVRIYGNNHFFSRHPIRATSEVGNPNYWNQHIDLLPAQTRCSLADGNRTHTGSHAEDSMLEGQRLFTRAEGELSRGLFTIALLAGIPPAQRLFAGRMYIL